MTFNKDKSLILKSVKKDKNMNQFNIPLALNFISIRGLPPFPFQPKRKYHCAIGTELKSECLKSLETKKQRTPLKSHCQLTVYSKRLHFNFLSKLGNLIYLVKYQE